MVVALELKQQTLAKEHSRLFNFIRNRVASTEDAEDVLQDVLYVFFDRYEIETAEKGVAWLFRVARNKIIDKYRRKKFATLSLDTSYELEDESDLSLKDLIPDLGNGPDDLYFKDLIWEKVWEAINELPELQREVFILNELEGVGFKEISQSTGASINTLLSRKRYAILSLRRQLQEFYNDL